MAVEKRTSFRRFLLAATALAGLTPCPALAGDPREDFDELRDHDEDRWTVFGIVNRALIVWDDGAQQGIHSVDNPQDSTGVLLEGEFGTEGWTSGLTISFDTFFASSDTVDQLDWDGEGLVIEMPYLFGEFGHQKLGEIELGQTDSASDEIDNINLAESDAIADASVENWIGNFFLRAAGVPGDAGLATGKSNAFNAEGGELRWGDFINGKLAGESGRFITYASPKWDGFEFSAALGQPQEIFVHKDGKFEFNDKEHGIFADAALRYAKEWGNAFRVEAGIGIWRDTTEEVDATEPTEDTGFGGSLAVRHLPSGLNIAVNYGNESHTDRCEVPGAVSGDCRGDDEYLYVKGGIVRDFTRLGPTALYAEYHRDWKAHNDSEDLLGALILTDGVDEEPPVAELRKSSVAVWGVGIVQEIEPVHPQIDAMQLYLGYRHYSLDVDLVGADGPVAAREVEDVDVAMMGLTVHWGGPRESLSPEDAASEDGWEDAEALIREAPTPAFEGGAPLYDWSGLYIGAQAGYFDVDSDGFFATSVDLSFCGGGFLAGGQVGWNWQRGHLVFGIEPDFAFFDCSDANLREEHYVAETDFLSTLRGRVGWARDNVLFYATGGLAFLHASVKTSLGGQDEDQIGNEDSKDVSTFGGVVGAGIEWGITRNLSIKTEGLYLFLDREAGLADLEEGCAPGEEGCLDSAENFFAIDDGFLFRIGANWRLWSESGEASPYGARPDYLPASAGPYQWGGLHVGAHVGYGDADTGGVYDGDRTTNPPPPDPSNPAPIKLDSFQNRGLLAGAQAGFDWQRGSVVFGIEGDISAVDWDDLFTDLQAPESPETITLDFNLLATARGRIGWAANDWLFYLTGGIGFLQGEFRDITSPDSKDVLAVGGVLGAGIEWGVAPDLSVKAEGLYLAFDEVANLADVSGVGVDGDRLEVDNGFAFRLGGNWRPWQEHAAQPAPSLAQYETVGAAPYNWRGIYGGANFGWGGLIVDGLYNPSDVPSEAIDLTGVSDVGAAGGGQIGLNWQRRSMVFGLEGDVAAVDWSGRESEFANLDQTMSFNSDLLATLRGRIGWAENDLLFYLTGGVAFIAAELDNTQNDGGQRKNLDAIGGVAGLGMEWGITPNLSLKTEGLFLAFAENTDIADLGSEGDPGDFFLIDDGFVARLGANWRFDPFH